MSDLLPILRDNVPVMSVCSFCPVPGACCKNFALTIGFWEGMTNEQVRDNIRSRDGDVLPFDPIGPDETDDWHTDDVSGNRYKRWRFSCPHLSVEGRCMIYSTRPKACHLYYPGSDALCVMFPFLRRVDA